jgi:hypothetical protein
LWWQVLVANQRMHADGSRATHEPAITQWSITALPTLDVSGPASEEQALLPLRRVPKLVMHQVRLEVRFELYAGYYGVFLRDLDGNNVEAVNQFHRRRAGRGTQRTTPSG